MRVAAVLSVLAALTVFVACEAPTQNPEKNERSASAEGTKDRDDVKDNRSGAQPTEREPVEPEGLRFVLDGTPLADMHVGLFDGTEVAFSKTDKDGRVVVSDETQWVVARGKFPVATCVWSKPTDEARLSSSDLVSIEVELVGVNNLDLSELRLSLMVAADASTSPQTDELPPIARAECTFLHRAWLEAPVVQVWARRGDILGLIPSARPVDDENPVGFPVRWVDEATGKQIRSAFVVTAPAQIRIELGPKEEPPTTTGLYLGEGGRELLMTPFEPANR